MCNLHINLEKLYHDLKGDRALHELMLSGITQCAFDPTYTPDAKFHDKSVEYLIAKQAKIGWQHILCGRISKSIVKHQDKVYRINHADERVRTGKRWATQLTINIWKTVLKLWKTRCELTHGRDTDARQQHAQHVLAKRVNECYNFLPNIVERDRHMFGSSASETLNKNPNRIETWLYMLETLIRQVKKEMQQRPKNQRPISDYFKKPSYNIHMREVHSKRMKNQSITKFFNKKQQ
jgi:hypothetical protein